MEKQISDKLFTLSLIILVLFVSGLTGCRILGGNPNESLGEGITPGSISEIAPVSLARSVSFRIILPERPAAGENYSGSVMPAIRAFSLASVTVTFQLVLVNPGVATAPTTTLSKTVPVDASGTAVATFSAVPALSCIGNVSITNGQIGSYTDFHGAQDLLGNADNVISLSPIGSKLPDDVLAQTLKRILSSKPELFQKITGIVKWAAKNLATVDYNSASVYDSAEKICLDSASVWPVVSSFKPMRAMSIGGNFGGNATAFKNVPDTFVQALASDNLNWVGIKLSIFYDNITDPVVKIRYRPASDTDFTNLYSINDSDLINMVNKFKMKGINVYLSLVFTQTSSNQAGKANTASYCPDPHLIGDPEVPAHSTGSWWGADSIVPELWWWSPSHASHTVNVATFWSSYTQVAVKYAKLCQQLGVGMFGIGEETDRLFRTRTSGRFPSNFRTELSQMVAAIRAEYSGLLTYGQQSLLYDRPLVNGFDTGASSELFKDLGLDVVGISVAYALSNQAVTRVYSITEMETAWASVFNKYLLPLQNNNPGIPIIFSDCGCANTVNAPFFPCDQSGQTYVFSDLNGNGVDDGMEQQAIYFQGLLNTNRTFNYLLRGTICAWSMIDTDPTIANYYLTHRDIQIRGKPAELVISNAYLDLKTISP
ncbi:MAG: hypothetical protein HQM09_17145 [Candidatus Riflebacteria bacterium]|nr:hypothetical protein [Candidatus Riflebacteria bacterium]